MRTLLHPKKGKMPQKTAKPSPRWQTPSKIACDCAKIDDQIDED